MPPKKAPKTPPHPPIDKNALFVVQGTMLRELVSSMCCGEPMVYDTDSNARKCQYKMCLREVARNGTATEFSLECNSSPLHRRTIYSCDRVENGPYRSNVLFVLACILKGEKFDDMVKTMAAFGIGTMGYVSYAAIRDTVQVIVTDLAERSRAKWIKHISSEFGHDVDVEIDGTWSKRYGHNALFGLTLAVHAQTKKLIGIYSASRFCHTCSWHKSNDRQIPVHNCEKNWNESAGAMEKEGFKQIGLHLLENHNLRCMRVLADGDSKGFNGLTEVVAQFYVPEKLNDKSHYAKRFLNLLGSLAASLRTTVMSDGKPFGGSTGRMTGEVMKDIRIRIGSNLVHHVTATSTLEEIRNWIRCVLYHKASTDDHPRHEFCSIVFCRYLQAQAVGKEKEYLHDPKKTLAIACAEVADRKFCDLTTDELLNSLKHEYSTNHAESANSVLWSIDKKDTMSSADNVNMAAGLMICCLNDGYEATYNALYGELGLKIPDVMLELAREKDASPFCGTFDHWKPARSERCVMADHEWTSWANEQPLEKCNARDISRMSNRWPLQHIDHKGEKWPSCKCVTTFPVGLPLTTVRFPQTILCGHSTSEPSRRPIPHSNVNYNLFLPPSQDIPQS